MLRSATFPAFLVPCGMFLNPSLLLMFADFLRNSPRDFKIVIYI
ncbi:hypothetical protein CISECK367B_07120 [Citrobacter sedlakii]